MRRWPRALGVLTVLSLSACAGTTAPGVADPAAHDTGTVQGTPGTETGTVQGTFEMEGGPIRADGSQPSARPLSGVVTFQGQDARVSVRTGTAGRFSVRLPAGTYTVSGRTSSLRGQLPDGRSADPPCSSPLTTTVRAGTIDRVTVTCIVP